MAAFTATLKLYKHFYGEFALNDNIYAKGLRATSKYHLTVVWRGGCRRSHGPRKPTKGSNGKFCDFDN